MHLLLLGVNQAHGVRGDPGSQIPELHLGDSEPVSLCPVPVFSGPMLPLKATQKEGVAHWLNQPCAAPADTAAAAPTLSPGNRASLANHVQEVRLLRVESISDLHSGGEGAGGGAGGVREESQRPITLLMPPFARRLAVPLPGRGGTAMG